jgi:site-specific recombinase XerC
MALQFAICEVRWEKYPKVSENAHAKEWLKFQSTRGLAANTLEAYGRDLDAYLAFLACIGVEFQSVVRNVISTYIQYIAQRPAKRERKARTTLSNATLQQHLTVIRLFYDYLVEERVCIRHPLRPTIGGRGLIQRHRRLPWIPSEEQWQGILQVCKQEPLRNRVMLAMSTIASQLFNAKEPMTLFELQEWLGHATPAATQHYAKIAPTKLAKSYADAGYFTRNLRAIEVLVDQESVRNGRAVTEPWKFYDLGHGYCAYEFFDQCPHRMACAKCSFYLPKESTKAQLLEGKANLLRLRQDIPLVDAELAAVEDGLTAYEQLLAKLVDVPTPAVPTPRQLTAGRLVQLEEIGGGERASTQLKELKKQ